MPTPHRFAALLAAVAMATTGCGIVTPPAADVPNRKAQAVPQGDPAISPGDTGRVLRNYTNRLNRAVQIGDGAAWRTVHTGPMEAMAEAAVRRNQGRPGDQDQIALVTPVLHVPRLTDQPKWFAAHAVEQRTGPAGKTARPVMLIFARGQGERRWRVAYRLYLSPKIRPPRPVTDNEGYTAVPDSGEKLAIAPDRLPDVHAEYLRTGAPPALFAPGPATTGARRKAKRARAAARDGGWRTELTVTAADHPTYAIRAGGGGALVAYTLEETVTLTGAPADQVPVEARTLLAGRTGEVIRIKRLRMVLAHVPPKGRVQVISDAAALVGAAVR